MSRKRKQGTQMTRRVHTGWDRHNEFPNMFRTWAECADEITTIVIGLPDGMDDPLGFMVDNGQEMADSPYYQMLLVEHLNRCDACRDWAADSTTVNVQMVAS